MAAELTYSGRGLRLSGKLVAGDTVKLCIDAQIVFPATARLRWLLTDARPPDARHTVAGSDELTPDNAHEAAMTLRTMELRRAFDGLRLTEAVPCVLELVDTSEDAVYCSLRVQVQNSRSLWLCEAGELGDISGLSAAGVQRALTAHEARRDNPHGVTAAQTGALSTTDGGMVSGTVAYVPFDPGGQIATSYSDSSVVKGSFIHLTDPDTSEGPCAYASGLVSGVPINSICPLMIVIENTGTVSQSFTLMDDDLVKFTDQSGYSGYVPCTDLAAGALCFIQLLVWKRQSGTRVFVRDYYRSDSLNNSGMMTPLLYSNGGTAFWLEVDENGGLRTQRVL